MAIPTTYDGSLSLREKILYVLSVLKKESVGELSVEITELDGISSEEGVAEITIEIEKELNKLCDEGVVSKLREHRQRVRYVLTENAPEDQKMNS